ncbi:hypothetical protein VU677_22690 [Hafnia paralvei]|uniref:hypothetical protein n=1 Tax=Hafnia paralvei TaxID=546367 RepID=UPI00300C5A5D
MRHLSNRYSIFWKWFIGDTDPRVKIPLIKSVILVGVLFLIYIPLFILTYLFFYQEAIPYELSFKEVCVFGLLILLISTQCANIGLKSLALLSTKIKFIPYYDRPIRATIIFYLLTMLFITLISLALKAIVS